MSKCTHLFSRLLLGATCFCAISGLGGLTALPVTAQTLATTAPSAPHPVQLHDIDAVAKGALNDVRDLARQVPAAAPAPVAADAAGDAALASVPVTAADKASDSAATTVMCEGYFVQSRAMSSAVDQAFKSMQARDIAALGTQLPALEALLAALPSSEIAPEVCSGNHINAYTSLQFTELSVMRVHNIDTGFPVTLPLVKQPDLLFAPLAYAVGWTKYEQKDFNGALAAYGKGLAIMPHDHGLQSEYAATLLQMHEGAEAVAFVDKVLAGTYDLDDRERGILFEERATGLLSLGAFDAAEKNFTISLSYRYSDEVKKLLDDLQAMRANAKKPG